MDANKNPNPTDVVWDVLGIIAIAFVLAGIIAFSAMCIWGDDSEYYDDDDVEVALWVVEVVPDPFMYADMDTEHTSSLYFNGTVYMLAVADDNLYIYYSPVGIYDDFADSEDDWAVVESSNESSWGYPKFEYRRELIQE